MKKNFHRKLIILGSGPAGYTAALYSARANLNPILITGLELGGPLTTTEQIENWPGDPNQLTGKKLMDRMKKHVEKFLDKKNILNDNIYEVDFKKKPFILIGDERKYTCDSLIIATGASAKYLNLKSEKKFLGKGVSICATCDGFFYSNKKVAVIGGGNNALEEAIYLSNISSEVHIIHRREKFRAEKILIEKVKQKIKEKKIFLHINYKVIKILGNDQEINGIYLQSTKNNKKKKLPINGVFIAIGRIPNTKIFSKYLKLKNKYIQVNLNSKYNMTQTSIKGIFAAGDATDSIYRQAITAAGSGCMAAIDAKNYLENLKE